MLHVHVYLSPCLFRQGDVSTEARAKMRLGPQLNVPDIPPSPLPQPCVLPVLGTVHMYHDLNVCARVSRLRPGSPEPACVPCVSGPGRCPVYPSSPRVFLGILSLSTSSFRA